MTSHTAPHDGGSAANLESAVVAISTGTSGPMALSLGPEDNATLTSNNSPAQLLRSRSNKRGGFSFEAHKHGRICACACSMDGKQGGCSVRQGSTLPLQLVAALLFQARNSRGAVISGTSRRGKARRGEASQLQQAAATRGTPRAEPQHKLPRREPDHSE